jgi:hypothetical protein
MEGWINGSLISFTLTAGYSSDMRVTTTIVFAYLRSIAAHFIASRFDNDHKLPGSTLRAVEAMVFQDIL